MSGPETDDLLGYSVTTMDLPGCVTAVVDSLGGRVPSEEGATWLACLNPHSYAVAYSNARFAAALRSATWLVPDGVGIMLASRLLGGRVRRRITGAEIFTGIMAELNRLGGRTVFFLGGSGENLAAISRKISIDYPGVRVVGTFSPPYREKYSSEEIDAMVNAVNDQSPDVLWVGLTAPKQELWIAEVINRLDVRFAAGVGAVFDFYTGRVRRSHPFFQRLGLEWLPRLLREPRRLWRRMFVSAPIFVWHTVLVRFGFRVAVKSPQCGE